MTKQEDFSLMKIWEETEGDAAQILLFVWHFLFIVFLYPQIRN